MTELPAGWEWSTFGDIARVASNLVDPLEHLDHPHIAPNHMESHTGRLLPYETVRADGVTSSKHLFKPGQLLYSKIRPYLAKAVRVDFNGLCSADVYPIDTELDRNFLFYWMLTAQFTERAIEHQGRSVLPKINQAALRKLPVPVAPRAEQERIVTALEEHLSRLDAAQQSLRSAERRLSVFAIAQTQSVLTGAAPSVRIDEIASVGSGTTPKRAESRFWDDGTIPWVTSGALNSPVVTQESDLISEAALVETSVKLWPVGTVLLAMYGAGKTRGRAAELGIEATCNQACAAIDPDRSLLRPSYLRWFLNSRYEQNRRLASGGVQPNLNLGLVKAMEIPLPSLAAQDRIIESLEQSADAVERARSNIDTMTKQSIALRQSLLAAAFSGKLVPQDPSDEPASVLLERIRTERAATKPARRSKAKTP